MLPPNGVSDGSGEDVGTGDGVGLEVGTGAAVVSRVAVDTMAGKWDVSVAFDVSKLQDAA